MQSLSINIFTILILFYNSFLAYQINFDFTETSKKIKVDSIKIIGNDKTEDFIILRELTFAIGDSVDNRILHYNRERIFSLGLFNKVEVKIDSIFNSNVIISVDETWYIYPIPFWYLNKNSIKNLTAGIDLSINNFRGRNEYLRITSGFGYDPFFMINYINPAISFNDKIGISFGFGFFNVVNKNENAISFLNENFKYKIQKFNFSLYKKFDQFNLAGIGFGFDYVQSKLNKSKIFMASNSTIDRSPVLSFYYINDTRDLKQYPDSGRYIYFNFTHKGLTINSISYNIIKNDFRFYNKLTSNILIKERLFLRNTFGKKIPIYDYSYIGYDEKIRGYNNIFFEGKNSIIASVELSIPIIKEWNLSFKLPLIPQSLTSARIGLYTSFFYDTGLSYDSLQQLKISHFNEGKGLGLVILILPFEIIRFEYSINKFGKGEFVIANRYSFWYWIILFKRI